MKRHKHKRPTTHLDRCPRVTKPHAAFRHIIASRTVASREYSLHATKGFRVVKVVT